MPKCSATTKDGPCRAATLKGKVSCFFHDASTEDQRRWARHRGGKVRQQSLDGPRVYLPVVDYDLYAQIKRQRSLLVEWVNDLLRGHAKWDEELADFVDNVRLGLPPVPPPVHTQDIVDRDIIDPPTLNPELPDNMSEMTPDFAACLQRLKNNQTRG